MDITLKSEELKISKIVTKTKAKMFVNLKVGDSIKLSIAVQYAGSNKGTYASYIRVDNLKNGEVTYKSFNQINMILNCFEFINKEEI